MTLGVFNLNFHSFHLVNYLSKVGTVLKSLEPADFKIDLTF